MRSTNSLAVTSPSTNARASSASTPQENVRSSTHVYDTSEWGYEVGFASGRFGRELSDGWDADRLDGTVTDADDRTFSWGVDAEDALGFVEGDVTASEFVDRIFNSMSEE